MKIKYSTDYSWKQVMYESDRKLIRDYHSLTTPSDYNGNWKEEDVTLEQLQEYVNKGYAIKINC